MQLKTVHLVNQCVIVCVFCTDDYSNENKTNGFCIKLCCQHELTAVFLWRCTSIGALPMLMLHLFILSFPLPRCKVAMVGLEMIPPVVVILLMAIAGTVG